MQSVWDSIALHGVPNIALYRDYLVAVVATGTTVDLTGPNATKVAYGDIVTVTQEEVDRITNEYPFAEEDRKYFVEQLVELCRVKPNTTYDNYVGDFGERYLANYSRVGHRAIDWMDPQGPPS